MRSEIWSPMPVIRLLIPFISGIGMAFYYPVSGHCVLILALAVLTIIPSLPLFRYRYRNRWIAGSCLFFSLFLTGILIQNTHNEFFLPNHFSRYKNAEYLIVRLTDCGIPKKNSWRFTATVQGFITTQKTKHQASGNLMLYFPNDSTIPKYGDWFIVKASVMKEIQEPLNPGEFNYRQFLHTQNIHHAAFLKKENFWSAEIRTPSRIQNLIYRLQHHVRNIIRDHIEGTSRSSIVQALVYGYDDEIDPELMQVYAQTGTLHVLAVSGMHVGMIFMLLSFILKPIDRFPKLHWLKNFLIIAVMWFYAAICGMTPSILRATLMVSFVLTGNLFRRKGPLINTMGTSALLLLCMNPGNLFNAGFQLSYLAVLGMLIYHPLIYAWITPGTRLGLEVWKISSISLAAQCLTIPVSLYYFHQFPTCFLISNLFIIPLTSVILYAGLLLIAIFPFGEISILLGRLISWLVEFTNQTAIFIGKLPYACIDQIPFDLIQCAFLYALIATATWYFIKHQLRYLRFGLILILLMQVYHSLSVQQPGLTIYAVKGHTAFSLNTGTQSVLYHDSGIIRQPKLQTFHIQGHITSLRNRSCSTQILPTGWCTLTAGSLQMLLTGTYDLQTVPLKSDLLLIRNPVDTNQIRHIGVKQIVICAKISHRKILPIKRYCELHQLPFHNVSESGAFVVNLRKHEQQSGIVRSE